MSARNKLLILSLFILSCPPFVYQHSPPCYPEAGRFNYTAYATDGGYFVEELGITIDDPRGDLDLKRVRHAINATVECVNRVYPALTRDQHAAAYCMSVPDLTIHSCMRIQVPQDWHVSQCTGSQVFPCNVPTASCTAKGQTPTEVCPCSCRAMIQDQQTILTAPNLELFPAQLTELLTGCQQIWGGPLAECGSVSMVGPP